MDKRDLLPASIQSDANFNVHPQYSRIEDRVASLKKLCIASTERLMTQCLLHRYKKVRLKTQNLLGKLTTTQLVCNYTNNLSY